MFYDSVIIKVKKKNVWGNIIEKRSNIIPDMFAVNSHILHT